MYTLLLSVDPLKATYLHVFQSLIHNLLGILHSLEDTVNVCLGDPLEPIKEIHLQGRVGCKGRCRERRTNKGRARRRRRRCRKGGRRRGERQDDGKAVSHHAG
jgi:hypothetical protein